MAVWQQQPGNLVVLSIWLTQAVTLLRNAWWQVCGCMTDSAWGKPWCKCSDTCHRGHGSASIWVSSIEVHTYPRSTWFKL